MKDVFSRFEIDPQTQCWNWQGAITKKSYGNVRHEGRYWKAHRLFYETYVGPIQDGQVVMHICDNPQCVNPSHLRAGSQFENVWDAIDKKRHVSAKAYNGRAKLNAQQVQEIMQSEESDSFLAKKHGVSRGLVWKIRNGKIKAYA